MKTSFNLQKFLKKAYYEDGRGLLQTHGQRPFMNCQKQKLDSGKGAQEAWQECLSEYQTLAKGEWKFKYASGVK
jgi:hypothetical protein